MPSVLSHNYSTLSMPTDTNVSSGYLSLELVETSSNTRSFHQQLRGRVHGYAVTGIPLYLCVGSCLTCLQNTLGSTVATMGFNGKWK